MIFALSCNSLADACNCISAQFGSYLNGPNCFAMVSDVSPRGNRTIELSPCYIEINNPRSRLAFAENRRFNLMHALNESLMLFASGIRDVADYPFVDMSDFSEDGERLLGGYGDSLMKAAPNVIKILTSDRDSRRAVFPILKLGDMSNKLDVPCTETIQFLIRDDKLHCFVNMRSNDFIWGFPYDVFQFTVFHETVANTLGLDVGSYHHYTASMHLYQRHFELLQNIKSFCPVRFSFNQVVGHMQWLAKSFQEIFKHNLRMNFNYASLILNDIMPPFSTLLANEYYSRNGKPLRSLDESSSWAEPFVTRWYKGVN